MNRIAQLEKEVLQAILRATPACWDIIEMLPSPEYFLNGKHRMLYQAILDVVQTGRTPEWTVVLDQLRRNGTLADVREPYMVQMLHDYVTDQVTFEAGLLRDYTAKRMLREMADKISKRCGDDATSGFEEIEAADESLQQLFSTMLRPRSAGLKHQVAEVMEYVQQRFEAYQRADGTGTPTGIPTGLHHLDKMLGGLQRSRLIIVGGATSMGKTSLAVTMLHHALMAGKRGLFVSLEMPAREVLLRLASIHLGMDLQRLSNGAVSPAEMQTIEGEIRRMGEEWPLAIDDRTRLSLTEIRAQARSMQRRKGLDILMVDYIGLMQLPKAERHDLAVGAITSGLKSLAKELDIPVVALCQLSRNSRVDKRPMLQDLRDSGSQEQDADDVLFVYRPEYYQLMTYEINDKAYNTEGLAEVIVAKQRNGPVGSFPATFLKAQSKFCNYIIRDDAPQYLPMAGEQPF